MTTATPPRPAHIELPDRRGHRLHCPRCEARLLFDGDEYLCVACGYELPADQLPRDVRRELDRAGHSRHVMMGLGAGMLAAGAIARGLGALAWIALVAGSGVAGAVLAAILSVRRTRTP